MELVEKEKLADGKSGEFWLAVDKKQGSKMVIKKLFSKKNIYAGEECTCTDFPL